MRAVGLDGLEDGGGDAGRWGAGAFVAVEGGEHGVEVAAVRGVRGDVDGAAFGDAGGDRAGSTVVSHTPNGENSCRAALLNAVIAAFEAV